MPQREAALFVYAREHGVDVRVVEDEEALRVLHGVAVLLQDGDAEAVEGADVTRVAVAGQGADALAHLGGGLVGEGHAEYAARRDAQVINEIGKAARQRPGLARARARHDADVALRRGHRLALRAVESLEYVQVLAPFFQVYHRPRALAKRIRKGPAR